VITGAGAGAHTWSTLFAGTATITSLSYAVAVATTPTNAATLVALQNVSQDTAAGSLPTTALAVTASVSAADFVTIALRGIVRVNAAGTLIPQIKLSGATAGASLVKRNSFFRMTPFGSNTAASLGLWS
jgi:hypothetical protein